jgi:hypothetical protein
MTKYVHKLSREEVAALQALRRQTKQAAVRRHCEMLLLSDEGLSPPQIGQRVGCSGRTVRR